MQVGGPDESFLAFVADSLGDLGIDFVPPSHSPSERPDVVFALIRSEDMFSLFAEAKLAAEGAPIIGILPIADDRLAFRALLNGAQECCSLDAPLENLRLAFLRATRIGTEAPAVPTSKGKLLDLMLYGTALVAGILVAWGLMVAATG